jgi:starch phosphorylase
LSKKANAVSAIHKKTLLKQCNKIEGLCEINSITNAQNYNYWNDSEMYNSLASKNISELSELKKKRKKDLFEIVADQCGEIYHENIFTLVFAKRFAEYKRADIFFHDMDQFIRLITNKARPIQIIWAGKPYPMDYFGIGIFDKIVNICKNYNNCSVLVGYELKLSKILKGGADGWLNMPRLMHEASGTSGMSAAMNGAVNIGLPDGWFPEYAKDKINSFVVPASDVTLPVHVQDDQDANSLYRLLETEILPMYYDFPKRWQEIMMNSMQDIIPTFDSNRMAREYYEKMY